jgi:hypothetical protein
MNAKELEKARIFTNSDEQKLPGGIEVKRTNQYDRWEDSGRNEASEGYSF